LFLQLCHALRLRLGVLETEIGDASNILVAVRNGSSKRARSVLCATVQHR
jgi:hypothetical protein